MYHCTQCYTYIRCLPLKSDDPAASRDVLQLYTCEGALGEEEGRCKLEINVRFKHKREGLVTILQMPQTAPSSPSQTAVEFPHRQAKMS